jgi:hypothetical protein
MAERVSLSSDMPGFADVADFYSDTQRSIRHYYASPAIGTLDPKFIGYSLQELSNEREEHLSTLDQTCAFAVLAALEASFRKDFHLRCSQRLKDDLSRRFRSLERKKGNKISFEEDIIEGWKNCFPAHKSVLSQLKGALNYRHWFAHGRYYKPNLGQRYDFFSVYRLALMIDQKIYFED